jgi:RimJ/RimL family protein N-acetyltransferase
MSLLAPLLSTLSLGWQTDLIFARFDGLVIERHDCLVVRTPGNPLFYWGNCIVLPEAPRDQDLAHWLARFEQEVGRYTRESGHVAIGFDALGPHAPLLSWQAAGFEVFGTAQLSLAADLLREPARPLAPEFRFAALDLGDAAQREAAVALQCASNDSGFEPEHYRRHRERQMARYAAMQAAGLGGWFGIWRGDQLLADCGLFRQGALGRFQHVGTHPAWRRRGLCSALIHHVTRLGLGEMGLQRIVMCADPHDVAIGIYEAVGYQRDGRYWGAQRRPMRDVRSA